MPKKSSSALFDLIKSMNTAEKRYFNLNHGVKTEKKYDYIFAGPPYGLPTIDTIPDEIFKYELLKPDGLFVMEHNPNHEYPNHPHFKEARNYGKTIFSFLSSRYVLLYLCEPCVYQKAKQGFLKLVP